MGSLKTHKDLFGEREKTMNPMTIFTTFFLKALLHSAQTIIQIDIDTKQISLLVNFSMLLKKSYWWPQFQIAGQDEYEYVHGFMKHRYFQEPQDNPATCINSVTSFGYFCTDVQRLPGPPITHYPLELYVHTILWFWHAIFVSNMTSDTNHQPLRSSLSEISGGESHINALHQGLTQEGLRRVYAWQHLAQNPEKRIADLSK